MALNETLKKKLAHDFTDLAAATLRLAMVDVSDESAGNRITQLILDGVERMAASDLTIEELSVASQNLVALIFEISKELPNNDRHASLALITKSWKKRCPGCPPWC